MVASMLSIPSGQDRRSVAPESPEALFATLDLIPDGMALLDPNGGLLFTNRSFHRFLDPAALSEDLLELFRSLAVLGERWSGAVGPADCTLRVREDEYLLQGQLVDLNRFGMGHLVLIGLHETEEAEQAEEPGEEPFGATRRGEQEAVRSRGGHRDARSRS